jgi:type VI secretion system secreted protein VgrG
MGLDIRSGIQTAILLAALIGIILLVAAVRTVVVSRKITFFRIRQQRILNAWRMAGFALFLGLLAGVLALWGEPVAYSVYQVSPTPSPTSTVTITPSITVTPTITLTPTITETPSETDTPTPTTTPFMPPAIEVLFASNVTPNPDAIFSQIEFSLAIDDQYRPVNPTTYFQNPVTRIFAVFSYDGMVPGVQWTALWFRDGELVHFETKPWDGTTGGYGYADWQALPEEWLPGTYTVQIFVGMEWKVIGQFILEGNPPTSAVTPTPSQTLTPVASFTPSVTPTPSDTPTPSETPTPADTLMPSVTPSATITPRPTRTPRPTDTKWPTTTP